MTLYNYFMSRMNQGQSVQQSSYPAYQIPQQNAVPMVQQSMNPVQKMQKVMQAMQNPSAFVKQVFPDIPAQIQNDPNQILQYLQQTRNISNNQVQEIMQQIPR